MAVQTPEQYYSDDQNWGSYQFVTLKNIIDEMVLESLDDDSYLKNTKRSSILLHAKQGIKKLTQKISNQVLAIEMTVGEQLFIPLPQDYVDYVRVSVVMPDFKLKPLSINRNISISIGYLQDHNAEILFDEFGGITESDSSNAYAKPYKKYSFIDDPLGGYQELDTSKLSRWGEFTVDELRGTILFSSDLLDKEIVLEYVSDGLQWETLKEEEIKIHKQIEEPLRDWIYYSCIERKRNVPNNEKQRALNRFKTTSHQALIKRQNFDINDIWKTLQVGSKML